MKVLESDPVFAHTPPDAPRAVIREQATRKFIRLLEHMDAADADLRRQLGAVIALAEPNQGVRLAIHVRRVDILRNECAHCTCARQYGLFMGALQSQAHPDLWAACEALNVRKLGGMIGCFGMTELGHGSNVAGIETTATLDTLTDEFIIHTPSLSATKWWIGGAAQTATFCVVYAQLVVHGERHGVKTFLVQLRNMQTFDVLPGIRIGDCGSKMVRNCPRRRRLEPDAGAARGATASTMAGSSLIACASHGRRC